ncbi:possible DNA-binding protein [Oceanicola granulosus HTCC2516]|uniref:Possible DNA-binding protein n=1 Tax=Oceanicola granulosus (strain ATCC BAA-861 / DSM 15982 / KCTC 12143 / HTCC2516) TaxID=314256 RepID=Q2CEF9_OCEGH|nr:possible DNA-binding protein [Oceanicola granulosus HTCC2516]
MVNLAPAELEDWLSSEESKSVGDGEGGESTGHKSGRRIVEIKRTNKGELTDDQWDHMATVVGYIKRHLAQGGPDDGVENSNWRYSLMNWGHDPLKKDS